VSEAGFRRAVLAVAVLSALLCLPFLGRLPLFDPDEGYYPAAAAESMASGHPLDLRLDGEPRWNKPPLSYALMQASMAVLGKSESAVRLPSVLAGAALVAILGLLTARAAGGRAGLLASVVLASSLGHLVLARAAHPEMLLVLGTAAAQGVLALWFVSPNDTRPRWAWWAAGLAMGIGFLAKGPTALAMPLLMLVAAMFVVPRAGRPSWGAVGAVFGGAAALALALAAPWYVWMGARHPEFWPTVLGEIGAQAAKDPEGLRASPFFFLPVLAGASLPWFLFLPTGLRALRRSDPSPAARFALLMALAAGTSFLFWSLSPAKNPHYSLVFLPPLAAVLGIRFAAVAGEKGRFREFRFPQPGEVALGAVFATVAVSAVLLLFGPGLTLAEVPTREFARGISESGEPSAPVAVYRKRLPSLTFYVGRPVLRLRTPGELEDFLRRPGTRFLVFDRGDWDLVQGPAGKGTLVVARKFSALELHRWDDPKPPR
jgi:4-amino-4-deoxy-L-arabinose transferase-like glycosyltransferase